MTDPMDQPPATDFGSDRYDYVEVQAPPGIRPVGEWFDALVAEPCPDCRANVFTRFVGDGPDDAWHPTGWHITTAHDANCPALQVREQTLIPWVVRWSDEVDSTAFLRTPKGLTYPDPREDDWQLGVLWLRETGSRTGAPNFGEVSTTRQRQAMLEGLCQVCGQSAKRLLRSGHRSNDFEITWVLPAMEKVRLNGRPFLTSTPPVCETCWPTARTACPNLRAHKPTVLRVTAFRPWGVFGEMADDRGHRQTEVQFGHPQQHFMLARQLVVEVTGYDRLASDVALK